MIRLAFYFGIGAMLHLVFIGSHFDFNSAWTWLWLFGWPFMLIFSFFAFIAAAGVIAVACVGAIVVCGIVATWVVSVKSSIKAKLR